MTTNPDKEDMVGSPDEVMTEAEKESKKENEVKAKEKDKKKRTVWEEIKSWLMLILTAVIIAGLFRGLVAEPIRVDGRSMVNTLQDGEIVIVTKFRMLRGDYRRGDVVICHYPDRTQSIWRIGATMTMDINTAFVKRLVALPGDAVAVLNGQLYVNDQLVEEDYIDFPPTYDYPRTVMGSDDYFVMGDNRASSHDSRAADVGPIREKMIVGHAKWVVFPFNQIRTVL